MASSRIDLGDFTCSICREIFDQPVSLACSHCYCKECLSGLKRSSSSSSDEDEEEQPDRVPTPEVTRATCPSLIYTPRVYERDQCFVCAICRERAFGYIECRDLVIDLETLKCECANCSTTMTLSELRSHQETCVPKKKPVDLDEFRKTLGNPSIMRVLSDTQAEALEKARDGQNRSTFPCPFCTEANFTVEDLLKHIERQHAQEDQHRVCPVCAAMPWGDQTYVSRNVYFHLKSRHPFSYETYVNYEQDEETMIALAIEKSLGID